MNYRVNLGYNYPEKSDEHMLKVKHLVDTNFDEKYPYYKKGFFHTIWRGFVWFVLNAIAFPVCAIRHGLKVKGRKILKENKELLKNGAITICNHVFMWDYLCLLIAIRPHLQYHIAWKTNFEGPNRGFIKFVGGVPVPTDNLRALVKFKKAIDQYLQDGKWLHVFPEGSMWFFYPDVRPFKPAVFKFAVDNDKPILPLGISYRPRKGLGKLFSKNPAITITIGEPILANKELMKNDRITDLQVRSYHIVQELCGIYPGDPTYNTDLNIENYKKTM